MAIYKATYCYPLLNSLDIRLVAHDNVVSPYQILKCKVDSSNKTVTGYQIRLLDGGNHQVFPVSGSGKISPISELSVIVPVGDIYTNSGLNGTMLHIPFFQNYGYSSNSNLDNMAIPSFNAIYYIPRYKVNYVVGADTIDQITDWTLSNNTLIKNGWDGVINGEKTQEGDLILFLDPSTGAGAKGGIWKVQATGELIPYVDAAGRTIDNSKLAGHKVVITNGKYHDIVYNYTDVTTYTPIDRYSNQWVDIEGNAVNLNIDGGSYKWEITLYQGDVAISTASVEIVEESSGNTVTINVPYKDYSALDYSWFDAVLNQGTILGSTNKRIQIADAPSSVDGGKLPSGTTNSALVLQGKYVQLLDHNGQSIADRSYVRSYDASYGHVYPMEDSFQLNWIDQAEKVRFYKHSNSEDSVLANEIVRLATTEHIDIYKRELSEITSQANVISAIMNGQEVIYWSPKQSYWNEQAWEYQQADLDFVANHAQGAERIMNCSYYSVSSTHNWPVVNGHRVFTLKTDLYDPEGFPSNLTTTCVSVTLDDGTYEVQPLELSEDHTKLTLGIKVTTSSATGTYIHMTVTVNMNDPHEPNTKPTWHYYVYTSSSLNEELGLITIDGYTPNANDLILVKDQRFPQENGVYYATATSWHRAGNFDEWGEFIGKILFIQEGVVNRRTNWESLAMPGGSLYNVESATSGSSALYFKQESPIVLYNDKIKYGVDLVGVVDPVLDPPITYTRNLMIDGVKLSVGNTIYDMVNNIIFSVTSITDQYAVISNTGIVVNANDYLAVDGGQTYGKSVIKIIDDNGLTPRITLDLSEAYVLKNTVNKTYISPYVGAEKGMAIKLLNGKKVTLASPVSQTSWLRITDIDTNLWCIKHDALTSALQSASVIDDTVPYTYELRSYFKTSDENPFYLDEAPYLTLQGNYAPQFGQMEHNQGWDIYSDSSGIESFIDLLSDSNGTLRIIQKMGLFIKGRSITLECKYTQFQQASWESYRWILLDYYGNIFQDTGDKYDKQLKTTFYGLNNEINYDANGNKYYAVLVVTDDRGNNLLYIVKLIVDTTPGIPADITFTANFDCSTQSVLLNYQDVVYLYPSVESLLSGGSYRYNSENKTSYADVATWDNSYLVNNSAVTVKDVGNDYNVPLMNIYEADPVKYCGLSQTVIHGLSYSHYFLMNEQSIDSDTQELIIEDNELYFETEVVLNKNYCGEFVTVQVEGDAGSNSYLQIKLSVPENFPDSSHRTISDLVADRNKINLTLTAFNGISVTHTKSTNLNQQSDWCSTNLSKKFILQPTEVAESALNEYHAFVVDGASLWYKPIKYGDGRVKYYLNSKASLGNLGLFDSGDIVGPSYWSEDHGTLYFYDNNNNMIDGLSAGEGINLINDNSDIPHWPNGANEDNRIWDDSNTSNTAPITWDNVTENTPGFSRWKPMNRHPDSQLASNTWRVIIRITNIDTIYSGMIANVSNINFSSDEPDTTTIKYSTTPCGTVVFKKIN